VCVLFSQSVIWGFIDGSDQFVGIVLNSVSDLGGNGSSTVVSSVLGEGDSERKIVVDRFEISFD
jgi:hypothetical protein